MTDSEKNTLLLQWLRLHLENRTFTEQIYLRGYRKAAVCGYREYGRAFAEELKKEGMEAVCIIEKNYESLRVSEHNIGIPILGFSEEINRSGADVIIVTPDLDKVQVRENLEMAEIHVPMIGMEQLLYEF